MVAGVGVVAVLALTLIVLSVRGGSPPVSATTTTLIAAPTTTDTTSLPSSNTNAESTTVTTSAAQRTAEVEALLQDLWFGWFDAIYRKDPDALWQVVATTTFHNAGVAQMESMEFIAAPTRNQVVIADLTILLDRRDCLVVENSIDMTAFRGFLGDTTVTVMWPDERYGLRFATGWQFANDLWLNDCDNLVRDFTP